ncbi:MAG: hypothetical protein ACREPC_02155 [Stenotrophomonas sp.]|uniref:hypothetical protein n=1 Tax=Stenotrophomonas sp. TaxID=69392 RepID=UPI003D6CF66B
MDAGVRRARVADAVALALKDAPLFPMGEQLPGTLDARVDSLDLRGELRGRAIASAYNDVMNMPQADAVFSTSDPYHFIQRSIEAALERERHSYASGMQALDKEAAIDRLVDQFLAAEEQLKQEAVDRVFPATPGH